MDQHFTAIGQPQRSGLAQQCLKVLALNLLQHGITP
jgi:hypothetical protein